jgi:hypothetical protein
MIPGVGSIKQRLLDYDKHQSLRHLSPNCQGSKGRQDGQTKGCQAPKSGLVQNAEGGEATQETREGQEGSSQAEGIGAEAPAGT